MEDSAGALLTIPAALAMVGALAGDLAPPPRTSGRAPAASAALPNGSAGLPKQPPEAPGRTRYPPGKGKTRPPFPNFTLPDHQTAVSGRPMRKRQTLPCPSPSPGKDRSRAPVELAIPLAQQPKWVARKLRTRSEDKPGRRHSPSKSNMKQPAKGRGRQKLKSAIQKTPCHAPESGKDTSKPPVASDNAKPSSSAEQAAERLANRQFWKQPGSLPPSSYSLRTGSDRPPASSAGLPKQQPKSATDAHELLSRLRAELESDPPAAADLPPAATDTAVAQQHPSPTKRKGSIGAAVQAPERRSAPGKRTHQQSRAHPCRLPAAVAAAARRPPASPVKQDGKHPAGRIGQATARKHSHGQGKRLKRAPHSQQAPAAAAAAARRPTTSHAKRSAGNAGQAPMREESPQGKHHQSPSRPRHAHVAATVAAKRQRPSPAQLPAGDAGQAPAHENTADWDQGTGRPQYAEAILVIPRKLGQKAKRSIQVSTAPLPSISPPLHAWGTLSWKSSPALCAGAEG